MRIALVLAAALALAASAVAGAVTPRPSLRIARIAPSVLVRGTHFRARERVRVTLVRDATRHSTVVRTSSTGTFAAKLGALPGFDPCNDVFLVVAVGGTTGERATAKYIGRECPPAP